MRNIRGKISEIRKILVPAMILCLFFIPAHIRAAESIFWLRPEQIRYALDGSAVRDVTLMLGNTYLAAERFSDLEAVCIYGNAGGEQQYRRQSVKLINAVEGGSRLVAEIRSSVRSQCTLVIKIGDKLAQSSFTLYGDGWNKKEFWEQRGDAEHITVPLRWQYERSSALGPAVILKYSGASDRDIYFDVWDPRDGTEEQVLPDAGGKYVYPLRPAEKLGIDDANRTIRKVFVARSSTSGHFFPAALTVDVNQPRYLYADVEHGVRLFVSVLVAASVAVVVFRRLV